MALESRWGGIVFPLVAGDLDANGQLYSVADPARDRLIALLNAALTAELDAVWDVAKVGTALAGANVVASTIYREPDQGLLRSNATAWPLLAVYRTGEPQEYEWFTTSYRMITSTWRVDYILGPLNEADMRRLGGMLELVPRVVADVVWSRGHSSYESGTQQFGLGKGDLAGIDIARHRADFASFSEEDKGLQIPVVAIELTVQEIEEPHYSATAVPFEGADFSGEIMDNKQS